MATARSFAQHFIECENCEENPAQFLCKTCVGHLCEICKTEHESRKLTKNHELIHLHKNKEGTLGLLYCEKHNLNKLEWYCSPCKEPVCAKCLMESHNGHKMDDLAKVHKEIKTALGEERDKIERILLPKFENMLIQEKTKKAEILSRTEEVKKQLQNHTKSIIDQIIRMKENSLQILQEEKEEAIKSVEKTENEIKRKLETLENMNEGIKNNLGAKPGIIFFKNQNFKVPDDLQETPPIFNYELGDFQPGEISLTPHQFGISPKFIKLKETVMLAENAHLRESNEVQEKRYDPWDHPKIGRKEWTAKAMTNKFL
ncbi:E3 ubiquitin-protein ligase Trim36-like [Saccostrea cucullata]|uniref:E3 ubiquitin-protein ligase Trim36-like n=1 Tax=Saccostrea cuccullata TaxID=36930 RepID=UPI002ED6641F